MIVAVVGSRSYPDLRLVNKYIACLPRFTVIVTGGARGVDRTAEQAAARRGLKVIVLKPSWQKHGRGAGIIRNDRIVRESDTVIAFWDGRSPGTRDVIQRALKVNKLGWIFMAGSPPTYGGEPWGTGSISAA